jgi:hypothetical protein
VMTPNSSLFINNRSFAQSGADGRSSSASSRARRARGPITVMARETSTSRAVLARVFQIAAPVATGVRAGRQAPVEMWPPVPTAVMLHISSVWA